MNRCEKCKVVILDRTDRCPLCQHVLKTDGSDGTDYYPDAVTRTKKARFAENLILFLSILAECICIWINYTANPKVAWSFMVGLILLYANAALRMAVIGKVGYLFKILTLVILAIAVLLGIDYLAGYRGWSLNIVLPVGVLAIDLVLLILTLANRRNWQSYMMPQLFMVLFSLIPAVFAAARIIEHPDLSYVALGASVFLFLGTLLLGDQKARTELKRRFHI